MDIGKSLGYMFDDERGVNKLLVGGLISLVPILRWAATGYMLRTLKTVAAGAARPLPEWDDVVNDLVKGLLVTLAGMIYALPLLVTFVPIGGLMLTSLLSGGSSSQALDTINSILGLGTAGLWCLVVPYILLLAAWMPAATANYALTGEFGAFFRIGEIWGLIRRNLGSYVIILLVVFAVNQVAGWVGGLILFVGAAFTGFWANLVYGHLLGQFVGEDPSTAAPTI